MNRRESNIVMSVKNLSFGYKENLVLNDINLNIKNGEIYALIGKNGAGKTTLLKILVGIIKPETGKIWKKSGLNIGYCPENPEFYSGITAYRYLHYFCRLNNMEPHIIRENVIKVLDSVNLLDFADRSVNTYSKGMKQRLNIARSLLFEPEILILDEPLSGLAPEWKSWLLRFIKDYRNNGRSVIISSHELRYLEGFYDRAGLLKDGTIVEIDNSSICHSNKITYKFIVNENIHSFKNELLRQVPEIIDLDMISNTLIITAVNGKDIEKKILRFFLEKDIDFTIQHSKLDDLYFSLLEEGDKNDH